MRTSAKGKTTTAMTLTRMALRKVWPVAEIPMDPMPACVAVVIHTTKLPECAQVSRTVSTRIFQEM